MTEDISVTDIASMGVVVDAPPITLNANVFTDVRNVRFKDGAVKKITGELLLNNITDDLTASGEKFGQTRYFAVWENPNKAPLGCYYIWVVDYIRNDITVGQKIYVQDHTGVKRDITPASLTNGFSFTKSGWQHTLFTGGFAFIINNGIDKPHYILDTAGNTDINELVLAELPGWDSYYVEQTVYNDTFTASNTVVFDLGQTVNFEENSIVVTGTNTKTAEAGSPAGSGTVNGVNFVPGDYPANPATPTGNKFQIYTDVSTNTTVIAVGGLTVDDTIKVVIQSRDPVKVSAGIVQSFGNLLVAGDLTEISISSNNIIRRLSGVVRTSDVAVPGAVPANWNPFAAGVSTADEFTLSETNVIQEMKSLSGNMYIYSTDSVHVMRLTGNKLSPVSFSPITDEYGCLTKGAVVEYDGKHFVVGANDIYQFTGNAGNIASLSDKRIRRYFYDNLNPIHEQQLFTLQNHHENEIWLCYPTLASTGGECDEALIWNYRDNTWTIRDLDAVAAGDVGPIKGGGIPTATIVATGNSGNAGYTNRGKPETQAVTINGKTPKKTIGTKAKKTITLSDFSSFTTDTLEIQDLSVTGDTGPNTVNAVSTLAFPSTTFTYDRNQTTHLDGGASAIINGDSSIGSVSFPAISVLGTNYANGATITMPQFVEAVKNYINANNALSDWTASVSTNTLTLTSDVPGPRAFSASTFAVSGGATSNLTINSTVTGIGVYGITTALSPAISMTITAPAVVGVHAEINKTITLAKNLTSQTAIRDNIITQLSAISVFNGTANAIYSVATNGNNVRFTSVSGGNHSALSITFKTSYQGTDYVETIFGGNLTSSVSVVQTGASTASTYAQPLMTVTFPDGSTASKIIEGSNRTKGLVSQGLNILINASTNDWSSTNSGSVLTITSETVGVVTNNFVVTITSVGTLPPGFSTSTFTSGQSRAGRAAHSTTDSVTLTPPLGNAITVNFNSTTAFDPDSGSAPTNVEEITATEIATALQAAWTDTTYFTVSRTNEVLTFTSVARENISGNFAYTVVEGNSRTGTLVSPLITNSVPSNIVTVEGIPAVYAKMTRVTITINTTNGSSAIFDRHYGEGPGRLLDSSFTPAANDSTYGDTSHTTNADYLNAYYDPSKTQDATELAKPNGTVSTLQSALLAALAEISNNNALLVTPNSASAPTQIEIAPSQFSSNANYVTLFSPATEVVAATVAPTTTALVAVAEGTTVATTSPTQSTTGTTINTTFDIIRPWSSGNINPNQVYPIFIQSGFVAGTLFNRIRSADLGYDFAGTPYISYMEREQLSITPSFDTETLDTIAVWADGGSVLTVGGEPQRATLQVRARSTNSPGEIPYLIVPEDNTQSNAKANKLVVNDFIVADSYKTDLRITGRLLNYRIDDANSSVEGGYVGANNRAWNVSGFQLGIKKGGKK